MLKSKSDRLKAIRQLVATRVIASQDELLQLLRTQGYELTQATLSRDIKELKIAKVPDLGQGYRYMIPDAKTVHHETPVHDANLLQSGIFSVQFSGSLAVIKSRPGFASVIAEMIDSRHAQNIIGTIAGDDTVLLVVRENSKMEDVMDELQKIIPNIDKCLIN